MKRIDLLRRSSPHIILVIVAVFMLGTGCASGFRTVMPQPPEKYEKLGPASGSACGSMLIGPPAYNFIPVMLAWHAPINKRLRVFLVPRR
jgi:hypothetical protein